MLLKYDYVVVATGKDTETAELGFWEDHGQVSMIGDLAIGKFDPQQQFILTQIMLGQVTAELLPIALHWQQWSFM